MLARCWVQASQKALTKTLPGMPLDGNLVKNRLQRKEHQFSTAVGLALYKAHHGFGWNSLGE